MLSTWGEWWCIYWHKSLSVVRDFGTSKCVKCDKCGRKYGMHDDLHIILPWRTVAHAYRGNEGAAMTAAEIEELKTACLASIEPFGGHGTRLLRSAQRTSTERPERRSVACAPSPSEATTVHPGHGSRPLTGGADKCSHAAGVKNTATAYRRTVGDLRLRVGHHGANARRAETLLYRLQVGAAPAPSAGRALRLRFRPHHRFV